ncbi:MAG: BREX-1 system adenine-specific DNA-methyltransferase PglX, partial [Selenomonadaceae bacterium]|nr:BREX-1 system adenine-specific DNA-methyltransferase PglX [Selenomonadaceae bacterium]
MNKTAIKKYAIWARKELINRVSKKALMFGISEEKPADPNANAIGEHVFSDTEKKQRAALVAKIKAQGYDETIEEVAYTWFNRFAALRFMEVNGYLPSHVRVFTNDAGEFKPQILTEAIHLYLPGLDMDKIFALKEADKSDELFRYLIIAQCNALNEILPKIFQKINDYTELLLPDNLLREGSVIERLIAEIPEDDWLNQVQIIGWLYQYYNTEPKDKVFADLKKNIKVSKEKIPAATQLFTPDWIVRYMVENSLGRLWLEGHQTDTLKAEWKYYLDEAEQEPEVKKQLADIRKNYANITPENIRCIDPCMGSGHILCYLFDVLMQIYAECGYTPRDAVEKILTNNLYGLDIDDRAAQLAYFAVMMKARQYDRRFFSRHIQPKVMAIQESNGLKSWSKVAGDSLIGGQLNFDDSYIQMADYLIEVFHNAKEYGSILTIKHKDYDDLIDFIERAKQEDGNLIFKAWINEIDFKIVPLVQQAQILSQKYDVVVTNPPYMGSGNMDKQLSDFVKKNYTDSKSDLFACFTERCEELVKEKGYQAMITQHAWMFLSSFEKLRQKLLKKDIVNMAHLGARAFEEIGGEVVQTTSFERRNNSTKGYKGTYARLTEPTTQQGKEDMFVSGENRFIATQENFAKIPGAPVAYWVSEKFVNVFSNKLLYEDTISDGQNKTGNNEKYVRYLWEVKSNQIGKGKKWIFYAKGGGFRKWYGNLIDVVDWSEETRKFYRKDRICRIIPEYLWWKKGITWGLISSYYPSFRVLPEIATF